MIENAKRIAAGLLLLASLLPLAQCRSKVPVQPQNVESRATLKEQGNPQHPPLERPIQVWHNLNPSDPEDWVFALAFVWPVPLLLARWKIDSRRIRIASKILEIPLCVLTLYFLYWFVVGPWRLLSGGYAALAGITVYMAAIVADVINWKRKTRKTDEP